MDIGPTASLTGVATYINFYFKVRIIMISEKLVVFLLNIIQFSMQARIEILSGLAIVELFDIKEVGRIDTDIQGLGIFNWLAEQVYFLNMISFQR